MYGRPHCVYDGMHLHDGEGRFCELVAHYMELQRCKMAKVSIAIILQNLDSGTLPFHIASTLMNLTHFVFCLVVEFGDEIVPHCHGEVGIFVEVVATCISSNG